MTKQFGNKEQISNELKFWTSRGYKLVFCSTWKNLTGQRVKRYMMLTKSGRFVETKIIMWK